MRPAGRRSSSYNGMKKQQMHRLSVFIAKAQRSCWRGHAHVCAACRRYEVLIAGRASAHACEAEGGGGRAHGMADEPPTPSEKSPFGTVLKSRLHGTHRPPGMLVSPGLHLAQAAAPTLEEDPAAQLVQGAPPPGELVPTLHVSQPDTVHTVGCWPGGQVALAVPVQPVARAAA